MQSITPRPALVAALTCLTATLALPTAVAAQVTSKKMQYRGAYRG